MIGYSIKFSPGPFTLQNVLNKTAPQRLAFRCLVDGELPVSDAAVE